MTIPDSEWVRRSPAGSHYPLGLSVCLARHNEQPCLRWDLRPNERISPSPSRASQWQHEARIRLKALVRTSNSRGV